MTGYSTIGLQVTSPLGEKDEVYYWDTARFLIEGCVFKLPKYQFVVGSEYFTKTYLQDDARCSSPALDPDDDWDSMDVTDEPRLRTSTAGSIELEDVTAAQFRTFLKLLFPVHSTTTTLSLTRSEWLTILTLSTRWHFLEFRNLSLSHLEPQMDEVVEMITVGRRDFVPEWVLRGYEKLVLKEEAISEEESEQIGYRAAVKLYIVKEGMVDDDKGQVRQRVEEKFADELMWLRGEERARRTNEDVRIEEEELKRKMEEEERMAREEGERRVREEEERRVREEEERRVREEEQRVREEEQRVREEEQRRSQEEEERRSKERGATG